MSTRPLEKLPTIRAKLGSTIVFAVGMTVVLIFLILGYALRGSSQDTRRLTLLRVAREQANDTPHPSTPPGITVVRESINGVLLDTSSPPAGMPTFTDGRVHVGTTIRLEYAVVPVVSVGEVDYVVYAVEPVQGTSVVARGAETFRFLGEFWWQFLLAGTLAPGDRAADRPLAARGMTQPLRDMAYRCCSILSFPY